MARTPAFPGKDPVTGAPLERVTYRTLSGDVATSKRQLDHHLAGPFATPDQALRHGGLDLSRAGASAVTSIGAWRRFLMMLRGSR